MENSEKKTDEEWLHIIIIIWKIDILLTVLSLGISLFVYFYKNNFEIIGMIHLNHAKATLIQTLIPYIIQPLGVIALVFANLCYKIHKKRIFNSTMLLCIIIFYILIAIVPLQLFPHDIILISKIILDICFIVFTSINFIQYKKFKDSNV